MNWVPPWLGKAYCDLYETFGRAIFSLDDAVLCLHRSRELSRVVLSELSRRGYVVRVGRAHYVVESPVAVVFGVAFDLERISLKQRVYEPLLRDVLRKLFERFEQNLVSVVLYGSIARGVAKPTSDMDLLVVVHDLPSSFYDRATIISSILRELHEHKMRLWKDSGRFTNIDILPFTVEEAEVLRPLYLDFLFDATILIDKGGFMGTVLERLRKRVDELGGRRITIPSGKWYWTLAEPSRKRIEIAL
jgi:predicted nucleotidyltransferase